jgi:Fic family protein
LRKFDLMEEYNNIISNINIINLVSKIHEYKGKQSYLLDSKKNTLKTLLNVAKIQSISSSNKIEGIYTADKRINKIVNQKLEPKNRNEEEIAGYRDVLALIHENYKFIDINENTILQLHRDLYKYTAYSYGGKFKNSQNYIEEENEKGEKKIRFIPLSPIETSIAIHDLCQNYNELVNKELCDLLVLIPIFILDFVSIHPFNDGNGRMSRLLTLLLLYKADYMVGKYISIEKIIEETKDSYYDTLEKSSVKWHENKNDYSYFVEYYLGIILDAYKEFDYRINNDENNKITAYDKIINIFKDNIIPIDKAFLMNKCPNLSETTIERTLNKLLREDKIIKISGGRYTKYKWNNY